MQSLTYRTDDITRWGSGQGSDLAAVTIDLNFWACFSAIQNLEDTQQTLASIDFIVVTGNLMTIHLTDHRVLGPFTLPIAQFTPRGTWQPTTQYSVNDLVGDNGSLYLVITPHTSGATFSPFATDGLGHNLYVLLLEQPANELPPGGTIGQRLAKVSGSPYATEWVTDKVRLALFVQGQPSANELLLQYVVVDFMTLPQGLIGSGMFSRIPTSSNVQYALAKTGASIGSINFNGPSPESITVSFTADVECVPGDILTITAPAVPDASQTDISITLVANLT